MLLLLNSHLRRKKKTLAFLPSQIPQEEGLLIPLLGFETFREKQIMFSSRNSFIYLAF